MIAAMLIAATFIPTGPGLLTQLTVIGASENWQAVSDAGTPDFDAYVYSPLDGGTYTDLYSFSLPPRVVRGHIQAVIVSAKVTIIQIPPFGPPPDAATIEVVVADGPLVTSAGVLPYTVSAAFRPATLRIASNPVTGRLWAPADLGRLQFGLRVSGGSLGARFTLISVAVETTDPDARIMGHPFQRWRR